MKVSIIVAMDRHNGIGKNNDLLWHLPADMQFFKQTTLHKTVIMGRKNYDSLPEKFRPLPQRRNIVLTRSQHFHAPGCHVFHNLPDALAACADEAEVMIIGGGEIYREALQNQWVDRMYVTHVDTALDADTFFPPFDPNHWKQSVLFRHPADERHPFSFQVVEYNRITKRE